MPVVQGYKVIGPLLEALGFSPDLRVRAMTIHAAVPGAVTVKLECLPEKADLENLRSVVSEWVVVEKTGPGAEAEPTRIVNG